MTKKKTFNEVGDTDDKVTWNAAGTRKWRMTYTLLEVNPSWRKARTQEAPKKDDSAEETTKREPKKATKAKPKKAAKKPTKSKSKKQPSSAQDSFGFDS